MQLYQRGEEALRNQDLDTAKQYSWDAIAEKTERIYQKVRPKHTSQGS